MTEDIGQPFPERLPEPADDAAKAAAIGAEIIGVKHHAHGARGMPAAQMIPSRLDGPLESQCRRRWGALIRHSSASIFAFGSAARSETCYKIARRAEHTTRRANYAFDTTRDQRNLHGHCAARTSRQPVQGLRSPGRARDAGDASLHGERGAQRGSARLSSRAKASSAPAPTFVTWPRHPSDIASSQKRK